MNSETDQSIRLDQFMKLTGFCGTGGQAKLLIQTGEVQVNDQVETRRRRKLLPGDRVTVGDTTVEVSCE